jgi:metabolite-proton symporter
VEEQVAIGDAACRAQFGILNRFGNQDCRAMNQSEQRESKRPLIEAIVASTVGTTIEWYDFFLYGTVAVLVFPELFFPRSTPFVGQILALSTFATGFIARPVGGVVFGYLGDRVGRKSTLVATLLLMGISTVLVGCLPTAERIGPAAPVMLTILRFLQGVGVGGEWGGAVLLALETGHRHRRGFYASWPQAGVPLGLLASTGAVAGCQIVMSKDDFMSWGWRIPFYLSGLLIVVGLVIRMRVLETPLFAQLQADRQIARSPITETLRYHSREVFLAAGTRICEQSCFYLFTVYVVSYVRGVLELPESLVLKAISLAAAIEFFSIPIFGMLSDRWSRRGVYMLGCTLMGLFAFPYFALLETKAPAVIMGTVVASLAVCHAMLYSVQASLIPELFGTRLRYSGASLGYQLASPVAGGLAPIVAASLVEAAHGSYWPLAVYIILISVVSLVCVWSLAETSRKDIAATD